MVVRRRPRRCHRRGLLPLGYPVWAAGAPDGSRRNRACRRPGTDLARHGSARTGQRRGVGHDGQQGGGRSRRPGRRRRSVPDIGLSRLLLARDEYGFTLAGQRVPATPPPGPPGAAAFPHDCSSFGVVPRCWVFAFLFRSGAAHLFPHTPKGVCVLGTVGQLHKCSNCSLHGEQVTDRR
jgi:hypothetical protein